MDQLNLDVFTSHFLATRYNLPLIVQTIEDRFNEEQVNLLVKFTNLIISTVDKPRGTDILPSKMNSGLFCLIYMTLLDEEKYEALDRFLSRSENKIDEKSKELLEKMRSIKNELL